MLDTNALRSFVLAAETLNFTTVAERRNTVQSAVSAHIAKLEAAVGRTLLARGRGQPMSLTPAGEAFLVYARRLLALSDEAVETVRTAEARRIVRLGTTVTLAMSTVSDVLADYAAARPDVQIHIQCDRSDALLARLDAGEIDAAVMMDQGKHPARAFVRSQPLAWVCSPRFTLEQGAFVPLAFLTDGRDLRRYALEALDGIDRPGGVVHLSPHPVGVRAFVQSGLALTVMPASTVGPPLRIAPPDLGLPPLAHVALAGYLPHPQGNGDATSLVEMLRDALP